MGGGPASCTACTACTAGPATAGGGGPLLPQVGRACVRNVAGRAAGCVFRRWWHAQTAAASSLTHTLCPLPTFAHRSRARPYSWQEHALCDASASPQGNRDAAEGQHSQHPQRAGSTRSLLAADDDAANTVQGTGKAQLPDRRPFPPFDPDGGNARGSGVEVQQGAGGGGGGQALEALRRQVAEAAMQLQVRGSLDGARVWA